MGHSLHPDFGTTLGPPGPTQTYNGMPINIVGNSTPRQVIKFHPPPFVNYSDESDPLPADGFPVPTDVRFEGDTVDGGAWNNDADHHLLLWDQDRNELHEFYSIKKWPDGSLTTGSYSYWDLTSNAMRPNGWTSSDVAGLPVTPLLVRYAECEAGLIPHAIRFCLDLSRGQIWPARHPGTSGGSQHPPMGARVRLRADIELGERYPQAPGPNPPLWDAKISPINRAIIQCFKDYGMILADHAGDWFFEGEPDARWNNDDLHLLGLIRAEWFEFVDSDAHKVHEDSMEAR